MSQGIATESLAFSGLHLGEDGKFPSEKGLVRGRCSWHRVLSRPAMPVMARCSQVALGRHREDRDWHPRGTSNNEIVEIEQKQDNDGRDNE
jgi:hypothetical protein